MRPERDSLENFATEAFAWMLRNHPSLSERLLEEVNERRIGDAGLMLGEGRWETQVHMDGNGIADMVWWGEDQAFVFEHKVRGEARADQVHRYQKSIQADEVASVLIMRDAWHYAGPTDELFDPPVRFTWREVYDIVDAWHEKQQEKVSSIEDFLAFLKHEGLGPQPRLSESKLRAFAVGKDVADILYRMLRTLQSSFDWSFVYESFPDTDGDNTPVTTWREEKMPPKWGRMGLRFYSKWNPGLFAGLLIDPSDHEGELIDPELGPDIAIILDVGKTSLGGRAGFQRMARSSAYKSLCESVRGLSDWKVEARDVGEALATNYKHPILIQRSLANVVGRKQSAEEQLSAMHETIREGVQHFLRDDKMNELNQVIETG